MKEKNSESKNHGGSANTVRPNTSHPGNESLPERKSHKDKEIGIGMPVSEEEMEQLKEKAKKADD